MDLRRHNRPGSRQYMQPSPVQNQGPPQIFEDMSQQYGVPQQQATNFYQPQTPAQQSQQPIGGGWESYDLDGGSDYSNVLPPYDPFGQLQQQQQQQQLQQPGFTSNPSMGYVGPPMVPGMVGFPQQQVLNPQQIFNNPYVTSLAAQYGQDFAAHGKEIVHEKIEKYVSISKLKYYFAVDTSYVSQKLFILVFPFVHKEWAPKYNNEEPVPPRFDVNAPDLYIPSMAFVSYILLSAYMMGLEDRFSPEVLGMQASWSLGIMAMETVMLTVALYIMNINTYLKLYDLMAFCGYKFVPMIIALMLSLPLGFLGYATAVVYCSLTLGFFLLRTLRIAFLSNPGTGHFGEGSRRSLYLLLGLCFFQPVVIWFMTHSLLLTAVPQTGATTSS